MTPTTDARTLTQLLEAKPADFSDTEDITGFALLICQAASYGGLFLGNGCNRALITRVRKAAKDWVQAVRRRIDTIPVSDALTIINIYDPVHRIAYGSPADSAFINRHTLAAFNSLTRPDGPTPCDKPTSATIALSSDKPASALEAPSGDKLASATETLPGNKPASTTETVNPYTLFWQIKLGLNRKDRAYFFRPLQWYTTTLTRWYNDLSAPRTSSPISTYDTIQRVSILLQTDLRPYNLPDQDAFKQHLFNTHRHLLDDLSAYDLPTLKALYNLLTSSQPYLSEDDFDSYLRTLLETIITQPNTNRFYSTANSLSFFSYFS